MIPEILALILPITSTIIGFELANYCSGNKLTKFEIFSISFPLGMLVQSLVSSFINIFFFCSIVHYGIIILLSLAVSFFLKKLNSNKKSSISHPISGSSIKGIIFCSLLICLLSYYTIFPSKDHIILTGQNDLILEISMISSFAQGVNKHSNFLSGFQINLMKNLRTRTGILTFLYSSLIKTTGCHLSTSILIPTYCLFISINCLSFSYIYRKCKNQFISFFAFPTIILIGGFGYKYYVSNDVRSRPSVDFIFYCGPYTTNWGHPLLHNFLTSRINLLCLSLSLIVFLLSEADLNDYAVILSLLTFLVRPQSGFILSMICFILSSSKPIFIYKIKYYLVSYVILSILFLPSFKLEFSNPLWSTDNSKTSFFPFLSFPINAYGVGFVILIFSISKFPHQAFVSLFSFYFLACISLQQDHRFNFFTTQSVVTPLIVSTICAFISYLISCFSVPQIRGSLYGLAIFLFVVMWLSSLCGLYHRFRQQFRPFGENENLVAKWIHAHSNKNAVFASPLKLQWNPAVTRAGRVGFIAPPNQLQDYIPYEFDNLSRKLDAFIKGEVSELPVDYFIFQDSDRDWKSLLKRSSLELVYQNSKFFVLKKKD